MDEQQRFDNGLALRRKVLGDAYVDRALARRDALTTDYQDLVTRYAWGEVWQRPGLDRRTRSLIVMAILTCLNREAELKLHLRASAGNGVTRDEVKELFLQAMVYAGVPAANGAFAAAAEVFAELDAAGD